MIDSGFAELDPDVVLLQEVWEPAFAAHIFGLAEAAGYPYVFYGGGIEDDCPLPFPSCLNSGLLTLSKYPILEAAQFPFSAETGCSPFGGSEGSATKGFTLAKIEKDGFEIALFNTHTEADAVDWEVRQAQIEELMLYVQDYRESRMDPDGIVFVAGDFNVAGATSHPSLSNCAATDDYGGSCWEYNDSLVILASAYGELNDAHRNAPCFYLEPQSELYTADLENILHVAFSPGIPSELLDYIWYLRTSSDSTEQAHVVPVATWVHKMRHSSDICAPVCDPTCGDTICTRELSDHFGLVADFDLVAPVP
jgi:endonuclease/exonuclease/phosphatase family metal-dependent hydrolase